jgi:sugar lactone lactonase YvrE
MASIDYPLDRQFRLQVEDLRIVGSGFKRPECVLALSNGQLLAAHGAGGYSSVDPDGRIRHVLPRGGTRARLPNGIALAPDGRLLFADLGTEVGGIFAIDPAGNTVPVLETVEGEPLPPSNFVMVDGAGRLWFTVSTRLRPRDAAWRHSVADGFIGVMDEHGARIVADGLGYTNEVAFSPDGAWLYVNETYNQRTSRFPVRPGGVLGAKEVMAQMDGADLPDGLTFDAHGGAWITCIASNRLLVLRPDGELQVVLEDTDAPFAARVAERILAGTLVPADMRTAGTSRLDNLSSLAFGGPDLRTGYLGCLLGDSLRAFDSPVPGLPPAHWHRRLR